MRHKLLTAAALAFTLSSQTVFAEDTTILEIAWFKLLPGTQETRFIEGAQHVQDKFLPRFDGRIYRELLSQEGGDYWIDSIHWRSVGDFEKAAAEILTDPDGAPIMELIDPSTMAWFHADRVRHWQGGDVPQGDGYTELQVFRLVAPGSEIEFLTPTTDVEFLASAEAIQEQLAAQSGFVDRELFRTTDGWWLDLVHWHSHEAAEAAKAVVMADMADMQSAAMGFVSKIDPKSLKTFGMNQKRVW
ncbi:hypothetical protein [uncultured Litoreibacter sp.]|uniref:hypothetical protein n=1 Tax=uncultured Litoreibacter sp. TaxID=1392394 RepID=UPI00260731FD|nr:hypothetical protein [uncultured Litoreibacter sp.]